MLRLTAERRDTLGREPGATASHVAQSTITEDIGVSHGNTGGKRISSVARSPKHSYRLRDLAIIAVSAAILVAVYVSSGWLSDHTPQVIAGLITLACIALLGVVVAAVVAGPKS
jgi:hypothetical protein